MDAQSGTQSHTSLNTATPNLENPNELTTIPPSRLAQLPQNQCSPALHKVYCGLILLFIKINILGFDLMNDTLGLIILLTGLFRLRAVNHFFKTLYGLVFAMLALDVFSYVRFASPFFKQPYWIYPFMIVNQIIWIAFAYLLLRGLEAWCIAQGHIAFAKKLYNRLVVYLFTMVLTIATVLIPSLAIVFIGIAFFAYLNILVYVRRASRGLRRYECETAPLSTGIRIRHTAAVLIVTILLPLAAGYGAVIWAEYQPPAFTLYNPQDLTTSANNAKLTTIRAELQQAGLPQSVLDDLPDSEILRYEGMQHMAEPMAQDNDAFITTIYPCYLQENRIRTLISYQWKTQPQPAFAELFGIQIANSDVHMTEEPHFHLHLFEQNGRQQFLLREKDQGRVMTNVASRFRLVNLTQGSAYRGYTAITLRANNSFMFAPYYIRQNTFCNHKQVSLVHLKDTEHAVMSSSPVGIWFQEYAFLTSLYYPPLSDDDFDVFP